MDNIIYLDEIFTLDRVLLGSGLLTVFLTIGVCSDIRGREVHSFEYEDMNVTYHENVGLLTIGQQRIVINGDGVSYNLLDRDGTDIDGTWQTGVNPIGDDEQLERIRIYDGNREIYWRSHCEDGDELTCKVFETWDPVFNELKQEVWDIKRAEYEAKENGVLEQLAPR